MRVKTEITVDVEPCPFCGNEPKIEWINGKYHISCAGPCDLVTVTTGPYNGNIDRVLEAWNKRAGN